MAVNELRHKDKLIITMVKTGQHLSIGPIKLTTITKDETVFVHLKNSYPSNVQKVKLIELKGFELQTCLNRNDQFGKKIFEVFELLKVEISPQMYSKLTDEYFLKQVTINESFLSANIPKSGSIRYGDHFLLRHVLSNSYLKVASGPLGYSAGINERCDELYRHLFTLKSEDNEIESLVKFDTSLQIIPFGRKDPLSFDCGNEEGILTTKSGNKRTDFLNYLQRRDGLMSKEEKNYIKQLQSERNLEEENRQTGRVKEVFFQKISSEMFHVVTLLSELRLTTETLYKTITDFDSGNIKKRLEDHLPSLSKQVKESTLIFDFEVK